MSAEASSAQSRVPLGVLQEGQGQPCSSGKVSRSGQKATNLISNLGALEGAILSFPTEPGELLVLLISGLAGSGSGPGTWGVVGGVSVEENGRENAPNPNDPSLVGIVGVVRIANAGRVSSLRGLTNRMARIHGFSIKLRRVGFWRGVTQNSALRGCHALAASKNLCKELLSKVRV